MLELDIIAILFNFFVATEVKHTTKDLKQQTDIFLTDLINILQLISITFTLFMVCAYLAKNKCLTMSKLLNICFTVSLFGIVICWSCPTMNCIVLGNFFIFCIGLSGSYFLLDTIFKKIINLCL